jgi:hypothetical protein
MARLFVTDINLNKNELQNARIQGLSSAPSAPVTGQIYYDTSNNTMYYYNGQLNENGPWVAMNASTEAVQDIIGSSVLGGIAITTTYDDAAGTTTVRLNDTAVTAGSYGSTTQIPTFTVDQQGRLTAAGVVDVATQLDLGADNAHGGYKLDLLTDSIKFVGGEGIDTTYTTDETLHTITITGEDASTTNKGIASFADEDFTVTAGAVSIKNVNLGTQTTGDYVKDIQGTLNEITVVPTSGEGAQVTIGLPDDVTITNNLNVGGNLNVTGTINSVNTTQVNIVDNKINLNTDFTGDPTVDAGIRVERGNSSDVELLWNESSDKWTLTNDGTNYHAITRKFTAVVGDGTTYQYPVTHNLGTREVVVNVYDTATYDTVECDVVRTSSTVVTLGFTAAPASGAYTVVIVG